MCVHAPFASRLFTPYKLRVANHIQHKGAACSPSFAVPCGSVISRPACMVVYTWHACMIWLNNVVLQKNRFHNKWQYLYIESICNDPQVLEQNYRYKMMYSPDYKDVNTDEVCCCLWEPITVTCEFVAICATHSQVANFDNPSCQ